MPGKRGRRPARELSGDESQSSSDAECKRRRKRATSLAPTGSKSTLLPTPKRDQRRARSVTPGLKTPIRNADRATAALLSLPPIQDPTRPTGTSLYFYGRCELGQAGKGLNNLINFPTPQEHDVVRDLLQADPELRLEDVACGSYHTLLLLTNGSVLSFGVNDNGALGRDTTSSEVAAEQLETAPLPVEGLETDFRPTRASCGDSFSVLVSSQGQLCQFGSFRSSDGLLGSTIAFQPFQPRIPTKVSMVACGDDHLVTLDVHGSIWTSGNGQQGQLGRKIIERRKENGLIPQKLFLKRAVYCAAGSYNSFAILQNGKVYACGLNNFHQTGVAEQDGGFLEIIVIPTEIKKLSRLRIIAIACGEYHTLFLSDTGKVYGCGRTDGYELGLGDNHAAVIAARTAGLKRTAKGETEEEESKVVFIPNPTEITFPLESDGQPARIVQIIARNRSNMAISQTGNVYLFGFSLSKSLGFGENIDFVPTPTHLPLRASDGKKLKVVRAVYNISAGCQPYNVNVQSE